MVELLGTSCDHGEVDDGASGRTYVAAVALALLLFMVTKGPIFWLRREMAPVGSDFIDDIWVQSAFVGGSALLVATSWPGVARVRTDPLTMVLALAVPVLAIVSLLWSVSPSRTLEQGLMFLFGTLGALFAGVYVRRFHALVATWAAMQAGVALSLFTNVRHWPLALDMNGKLAGIYFNRNSLGPVALTGFASCVVLLMILARRRSHPGILSALCVCAAVDVATWYRTGSLTSAIALVCAAGSTMLLWYGSPRSRPDDRRRRTFAASSALMLGVGAAVAYSQRGIFADALGRDPTLAGRTIIWSVVDEFISRRSLDGWGFMAVWQRPEIIEALAAQNAVVYEAHSGYREVTLGMGLIGLFLLLGYFVVALARTGSVVWRSPDALALWSFGVVVYVLIVNLGETYVGANLLPWILLNVAVGQAIAVRRR